MAEVNFATYFDKYVVVSEQGSAVCLLCPSTVSSQEKVGRNSACINSHFEKLHAPKKGCLYCDICCKNIGQVGQTDQQQQHNESAKHKGTEARLGDRYQYCLTCGNVHPLASHNKRHKVVEATYLKLDVSSSGSIDYGTKDRFAQSVISYSYWNKKRQMSIGVWCNEHFEKVFGFDPKHVPVPVQVGEDRQACRVCQSTHAIWEKAIIRPGKLMTVNEEDYRRFVVGSVVQQHSMREEVSPADYAQLSDEQQDMYFWNKESKSFLLTVSKAKEAAAKTFLTQGAKPGNGFDSTDGPEARQIDASALE